MKHEEISFFHSQIVHLENILLLLIVIIWAKYKTQAKQQNRQLNMCANQLLGINGNQLEEILTIEADDLIWNEKHKDYQKAPADNFHHPTSMMHTVPRIPLGFHTNHQNSQNSEKQKIPQANPQNCIRFKPFSARCVFEVIDPCSINRSTLAPSKSTQQRYYPLLNTFINFIMAINPLSLPKLQINSQQNFISVKKKACEFHSTLGIM